MVSDLDFLEDIAMEKIQGGFDSDSEEFENFGNFATNSGSAEAYISPSLLETHRSVVLVDGRSQVEAGRSSSSEGYAIAAIQKRP